MPVERSRFKPKVVLNRKMIEKHPSQANTKETRTYEYVKSMETGGHKESRTKNTVGDCKVSTNIFKSLKAREDYC